MLFPQISLWVIHRIKFQHHLTLFAILCYVLGMSSSLNIQLTTELRRYVDMRASDDDIYATPSEYIRDLIRKDRAQSIVGSVTQGLREIQSGQSIQITAMDIFNEE
jgi:antitoxin ParD1/3/4